MNMSLAYYHCLSLFSWMQSIYVLPIFIVGLSIYLSVTRPIKQTRLLRKLPNWSCMVVEFPFHLLCTLQRVYVSFSLLLKISSKWKGSLFVPFLVVKVSRTKLFCISKLPFLKGQKISFHPSIMHRNIFLISEYW